MVACIGAGYWIAEIMAADGLNGMHGFMMVLGIVVASIFFCDPDIL
jgi:hypothetical protein